VPTGAGGTGGDWKGLEATTSRSGARWWQVRLVKPAPEGATGGAARRAFRGYDQQMNGGSYNRQHRLFDRFVGYVNSTSRYL
jgi:hypothetical protein